MYASIPNQLYQISHYVVAFGLVFVLYPYIAFRKKKGDLFELFARNFLKMVFFIIIVGYLLVILQLYEVIGITFALFIFLLILLVFRKSMGQINNKVIHTTAYVFDIADKHRSFKHDLHGYITARLHALKKRVLRFLQQPFSVPILLLFLSVLFASCYFRFFDAFVYPQPNMSDGAVTLSWIKQIELRKLFVNGIYPQGFSIYMATLEKYSFIDSLYILKYSGPFNELLLMLGLYFFVSRITKRKLPGILAMGIYGLCFRYLPGEYARQAATNSQEFGFVFILPTLYFFQKFLEDSDRDDLLVAFCGLTVIGLVHEVAFAFACVGILVLTLLYFVVRLKKTLPKFGWIVVSGISSVLIAALPALIGHYLLKMPYYASSESYAGTFSKFSFRKIGPLEYTVAALTILLLIGTLVLFIRRSKAAMPVLFVACYTAAAMAAYIAGGALTGMEVIENRSGELYAIMIPVAAATALYILLGPLREFWIRRIFEFAFCLCLVAATVLYIKPKPIIPYKMISPDAVQQYLNISSKYTPTDWLIVSYDETYDLTMCSGFHLLADDFLKRYSPDNKYLFDSTTGKYYVEQNIFLYYEKNLYFDGVESTVYTLAKRRLYNQKLKQWIDEHMSKFSNLKVYYENKNFVVYKLDQSGISKENIVK